MSKEISPKGWGAAYRRILLVYLKVGSQPVWGWQVHAASSASGFVWDYLGVAGVEKTHLSRTLKVSF